MIWKLLWRLSQMASIIGSVVVIYMLLLKLTGHSPTVQDVIISITGIHLALFVGFTVTTSRFIGKMSEFMVNTQSEIQKLRSELDDHQRETKTEFRLIHDRLNLIEKKLSI